VRNNKNQLKIHAFDDYFGYRALIDEVNVWVLPEISEELNGGLTLKGPPREKAVESRLEEGCYYLLFDAAPTGSQPAFAVDKPRAFPANLLYHAEEQYQTGSRRTACCRAGTTRDRLQNPPGWSPSP
jgi:SgrR family transcriptional regulator